MAQLSLHADDTACLADLVRERAQNLLRPYVIALDGRSGSGKSTLARELAAALGGGVLDGDGFYAGGVVVRDDSPEERARDCIDWRRQRPVLEALRAGRQATYFAFDWQAFDGRLEAEPTIVEPGAIIVFEGVYAGRPELVDLVDLRVLLRVSDRTRVARLLAREGFLGPWDRQWHEAEDWYFKYAMPEPSFDVILSEHAQSGPE